MQFANSCLDDFIDSLFLIRHLTKKLPNLSHATDMRRYPSKQFILYDFTFLALLEPDLFFLRQVLDMINDPHYLYRMTILYAISLLAPVMGSEITCSKLLPVIITASKDG